MYMKMTTWDNNCNCDSGFEGQLYRETPCMFKELLPVVWI